MAKSIKQYFSGLSKNTFLIAFASLFSDIATEMLYPILPIFLTQNLKASGIIVGLIEGIAQATQNITQGFSGLLSDKIQKRKSIALVGYFLAAIAKPFMGIFTFWQGVLGARFVDRLSTGIRSAPRDAMISSSVLQTNRGKAFGLEGFADNLGAFLGPLVAIFLLVVIKTDLRLIFYVAFIPAILAFLMISCIKEIPVSAHKKSEVDISLKQFSHNYWKYLFTTAVFSLGNISSAFFILQTKDIGVSLVTTIFIYSGFNLVAAIVSYPAGFLSDRFGRKYILLVAFMIFTITYIGFALSNNIYIISMLFILYGLFQGIFRAVGKSLAIDLVPDRLHASGIGWYNTTIGLLGLMASIIAGLLWDNISHTATFLYGATFSVMGSIMLIWLVPSQKIAAINVKPDPLRN